MKKKNTYGITTQISLYIILFFIPNMVLAQTECPDPSAGDFLEVNNVRAWINNDQRQFFDGSYDGPELTYEIPAGSGLNGFFATNFWIAGRTPDDVIKIAAGTYASDESRYAPGPLNNTGGLDEDICDDYNRLFIVSRDMSETHYSYFLSVEAGTEVEDFPSGYQIPQVLLDYPGSIYTSTGLNDHGAPFYDYDEDGLYDATQGDFPLFSGMFGEYDCESCETLNGDVNFYWINNDIKIVGDLEIIGVEIHNMVYAFASEDAVDNTLFFQKKIINKGSQTLEETYIGIWADPDLGCYSDDFAACDVERNLGVVFNSSNIDEDCDATNGYGENPPSIGILGLKLPYEDPDGSGVDTEINLSGFAAYNGLFGYPQTDPINAGQYYNYLISRWQDGSPFTYGGMGIGGSQEALYMFPHDTDPLGTGTDGIPQAEWSEISAGNQGGDRRFVMSFGPFTMNPGEVNCVTYATIFAENDGNENPLNAIQIVADEVIELYDGCFEELAVGIDEYEVEDVAVFNWNQSQNTLYLQSIHNEKITLSIFDLQGKLLMDESFIGDSNYELSTFSSGVYLLKLTSENGGIQSEKILVSK